MTPASRVRTPRSARPPATCPASQGPDSRVSMPMTISGWGLRCRAVEPSAMPKAWTVPGSRGGSPATPRIPSVPNNCFPMLFLFHDHLDLHARGRLKPRLRLSQVRIHAKLLAAHDTTDVDRIGYHRLGPLHAALGPGDGDPRRIDGVALNLVARMRG